MAKKNKKEIKLTAKERAVRIKLALIFGVFFLLSGAGFLYSIFNQISDGVNSSRWPSVQGEVISSNIEERKTTRTSGAGTQRSTTRRSITRYYPGIEYSYTVNGISYQGNNLNFYGKSGLSWSQEKVAEYPVGRTVKVFYHPNNHNNSVLEPGTTIAFAAGTGSIVFFFALIFFLIAYFCFRDYKKVKNAPSEAGLYYIK